MEIKPAPESIDWLYAASSLPPPPRDITFDEVRARVQLFNRDSMLDIGASIMWFLWREPERQLTAAARKQAQITWAHAVGLMGLVAIYGQQESGLQAREADFRALAHELFLCPSGAHRVNDPDENATLLQALEVMRAKKGRERLQRIPVDDIRAVHVAAHMAQLAHNQRFGHTAHVPSRWVRPIAIYELLLDEATKSQAYDRLRRAERAALRTHYKDYVWSMHVLFNELCRTAEPSAAGCPGVLMLGPHGQPGPDWGSTRWSDVRVTAERLALRIDEPRAYAVNVSRRPAWERQFCPEVWLLRDRPMLSLPPDRPGDLKILAPSPWLLLDLIERELLYSIPWAAQTRNVNFLSLRGEAFHRYLELALADLPGVLHVDSIPQLKGKRADQIILGERFGLIVEAKATLSPLDDLEHRRATSIIKAWTVGCEAIEQGAALMRRPPPSVSAGGKRTWIKVITTLEPGAADATFFVAAAKRWDLLADSGFEALHIADVAELEHVVIEQLVDAYGELILRRWAALAGDFINEHPPIQLNERRALPYLVNAWKRFYGDASCPW